MVKGERVNRQNTKLKGWHITLDDGYCSFMFKLNASGDYSIDRLFRDIQKSVKKRNQKIWEIG